MIAEDSLIVREGIQELLSSSPTTEVVATCDDADCAAGGRRRTHEPDVVLTDIRMPPTRTDEGIQLAARLRESHPDVGVVVLSQFSEPTYVLGLLESGSDGRGYLLKERVHNRSELVSAIDTVAQGGSVIDPKIVEVLVEAKARAERSPLNQLTPREREVLAEIAEGKSNTAIAESLVLTKRAVEKHINSIFMKLDLAADDDVSKRVKATLLFLADERLAEQLGLLLGELLVGEHALGVELAELLELCDRVGGGASALRRGGLRRRGLLRGPALALAAADAVVRRRSRCPLRRRCERRPGVVLAWVDPFVQAACSAASSAAATSSMGMRWVASSWPPLRRTALANGAAHRFS